jgi:hypothetical protein
MADNLPDATAEQLNSLTAQTRFPAELNKLNKLNKPNEPNKPITP